MSHLTMQQLEDLGFVLTSSSRFNGEITQDRTNRKIWIETKWDDETGKMISQKLIIPNPTKEQILKLIIK